MWVSLISSQLFLKRMVKLFIVNFTKILLLFVGKMDKLLILYFINKKVTDNMIMQWAYTEQIGHIFEPRYEKTGFLHMQKQRRRSASR